MLVKRRQEQEELSIRGDSIIGIELLLLECAQRTST